MEQNRQLRRAQLAEEIRRHRRSLDLAKIAQARLPSSAPASVKDQITAHVQKISEDLHKMEAELHELNVQQIREELSRDSSASRDV